MNSTLGLIFRHPISGTSLVIEVTRLLQTIQFQHSQICEFVVTEQLF
jgi:hypothetical protein